MNRKQKIIVSLTDIVIVTLILLGLTYGYFLTNIIGNTNSKSISVALSDLKLTYDDGTGILAPTGSVMPGTTIGKKTFTVTNTGTDTVNDYVVVLEDVFNQLERPQDMVYTVTCKSYIENITTVSGTCNGVSEETPFPLGNGTVDAGEGFGVVVTNTIPKDRTHSYEITLKYLNPNEDQSVDMGKSIVGKLNIKDNNVLNPYKRETGTLAKAIIDNSLNLTNAQKSDGYAEYRPTPLTIPAKETTEMYNRTNAQQQASRSVSVDATHQSYYWTYGTGYEVDPKTGKFTLTGVSTCKYSDSTCKTTLVGKYLVSSTADGNSKSTNVKVNTANVGPYIYKVSSSGTSSLYIYDMFPVGYSIESTLTMAPDDLGTSYYFRGGVKNNYLSFAGKTWRIVRIEGDGSIKIVLNSYAFPADYGYEIDSYGNNLPDYENNANRTTSLKYRLNDWYNTNLSSSSSKIKDAKGCLGDTTNAYTGSGTLMTSTEKQNALANKQTFYYKNYVRITKDKVATYKCDSNATKTTETKVLPLTLDEMIYAGGTTEHFNGSYYLVLSGSNSSAWLLSYANSNSVFYTYGGGMGGTDIVGKIQTVSVTTQSWVSVRPSLSLASGTQIAGGNGTQSTPYTIK